MIAVIHIMFEENFDWIEMKNFHSAIPLKDAKHIRTAIKIV